MKEIYYPNFVNEYHLVNDTTIKLMRRCSDREKRFIKYINFDSNDDCKRFWENECGA